MRSPATTAASGEGAMGAFKERLRHGAHTVVDPLVRALLRSGARADHLTWAGFVLSVAAGAAFFYGQFRLAAVVLAVAGICDILDGQLARQSGGETKFGAFLDSTLDRVAEGAVLLGLLGF